MSLKNFSKIRIVQEQKTYWKLYDFNGSEIEIYTLWTKNIQERYSFRTRDKYAQVVSKFLDYLVEVNIFEKDVTRLELKESINNYKKLLSSGKELQDKKLSDIAYSLGFNKLSPSSWSNNIAAINSFLEFNDELYKDHINHIAAKNKTIIPEHFHSVLNNLKTYKFLSPFEKVSLKQKSFLSNLFRVTNKIETSKVIRSNHTDVYNRDLKTLDFPMMNLPDLLSNTSCMRDRAIYSLLAGTGIRTSEALSLTWEMIDIENQKVYIYNSLEKHNNEDISFKGRNTNITFFIPELRHIFFNALYNYQLNEANKDINHNYVFQYLKGSNYGEPYYTVSRQGFIKEFKKTVDRAGIKAPSFHLEHKWTPHSLRHFYGVYMLNYIPVKNGNGFSIEEVQKMMGHKSIAVTQQYARRSEDYIHKQLEFAEKGLDGSNQSVISFSQKLTEQLKVLGND